MASVQLLDVLSTGSKSEQIPWFNLLRRSISGLSANISPFFHIFSHPPSSPWTFSSFYPVMLAFSPPFSLLFISPSSPTLVLVAAALRAQGLWLGQKRTICKTDKLRTGSSSGCFFVCMCVWRPALRRKGLKTKWRFWEPKTFLGYRQTRAKEELELQHRIYVIRDE